MKINLINLKKYYMIILPLILFVFVLIYGIANTSDEEGMMSAHQVYSGIQKVGLFPEPVSNDLNDILESSSRFIVSDYISLDRSISKYCGEEVSPLIVHSGLKAIFYVFPFGLEVFSEPTTLIKNQIEKAHQCKGIINSNIHIKENNGSIEINVN